MPDFFTLTAEPKAMRPENTLKASKNTGKNHEKPLKIAKKSPAAQEPLAHVTPKLRGGGAKNSTDGHAS